MYVNAEICNIEQRRINIVYLNVDTNNVRQHQNVEFYNVDQSWSNTVNRTKCEKLENKTRDQYNIFGFQIKS